MSHQRFFHCFVMCCILLSLVSCGKKETPEQRLERLRFNHEIIPVGTVTLHPEENPTLMVDLQIINQGTEVLSYLTVLVRVNGIGGEERLKQRVTLDLEDVRPGIGERRAAMVEGFVLAEDDEVFVELEPNLSAEDLRSLPEFADVAVTP